MRRVPTFSACLLAASLLAPARGGPVTAEHRALIAAAVPATAPAKPAQERRLLIFSQTKGFRHASIETGVEALTLLGARTGAYTATATEDPAAFAAEALRGYDAILFLNVTGSIFDRVESQQALLDFVRAGGGIAGIHSATDACYAWPEWGAMFGGWFDGHPWRADSHVTLWNEEPGHPLNAAFGGARLFAVQDEIYQLKGADFRATHRVLLSLDPRGTKMDLPGLKRDDRDFPITQIREYGRGRVFYCSLGHNHHIYWNPTVLAHYLAGLQWALGDLKAPATPRPRGAYFPQSGDPGFWDAVKQAGYEADPRIFDQLDVAVAEAGSDPGKLLELERRLAGFFTDSAATPAARQAAAQRLGLVLARDPGARRNDTLAVLGGLLADEAQVEHARLALEPVPGAAVDALFVKALGETSGLNRVALIHAAGRRRIAAAVPRLAPLLAAEDSATAVSAAHALGSIGNAAALKALEAAPGPLAAAIVDAKLALAAHSAARTAVRIYTSIHRQSGLPDAQRAAALRGLISVQPREAADLINQALSGKAAAFQQVALEAIVTLPGKEAAGKLAAGLPGWSPEAQIAVAAAFGRRGDAAAAPALNGLLESPETKVRLAAIDALGRLPGSQDTALRLARLAAGEGDEAGAAAAALGRLHGPGLDKFIIEGATGGEPDLRPVFIRQLARRGQAEAIPQLLKMRNETEGPLRLAALEALGDLATPAEQPAVLDWALKASDAAEQNRAVRTLISLTLRDDAVETRARRIIAAIRSGGGKIRTALLPVLPRVEGGEALSCLEATALDADREVALAAVTGLTRWRGHAAAAPLTAIAETTALAEVRRAVVAGAARILDKERDAKELDATALLGRLLAVPGETDVKQELLGLLGRGADEKALALAESFSGDPALAGAARDAADAIEANRAWPPVVTASAAQENAAKIADGRPGTHWSAPARAGEWLQLDLKHSRPIRRVTLRPARGSEHPAALEVFVSDDPAAPGEARLTQQGENGNTVLEMPAGARGRYLLLRHTALREEGDWSVSEITVD